MLSRPSSTHASAQTRERLAPKICIILDFEDRGGIAHGRAAPRVELTHQDLLLFKFGHHADQRTGEEPGGTRWVGECCTGFGCNRKNAADPQADFARDRGAQGINPELPLSSSRTLHGL